MQARDIKIKMPYSSEESVFTKVIGPTLVPIEDVEGLQVTLTRMKKKKYAWENKFHVSNVEKLEILRKIKEKDNLLC